MSCLLALVIRAGGGVEGLKYLAFRGFALRTCMLGAWDLPSQ